MATLGWTDRVPAGIKPAPIARPARSRTRTRLPAAMLDRLVAATEAVLRVAERAAGSMPAGTDPHISEAAGGACRIADVVRRVRRC